MTSFLEESTLGKSSSSSVICGNCYKGQNWSRSLLYKLFCGTLQRIDKYDSIVIVSLENLEEEFEIITNTIVVKEESRSKVHYFDSFQSFTASPMFLQQRGHYAIFISSLTDWILNANSIEEVGRELYNLRKIMGNKYQNSLFQIHLYTTLYTTLHSFETVQIIQSWFPTVVRVLPNDGIMFSPMIAAEVHTIRRSEGSNKMSEALELFIWSSITERTLTPFVMLTPLISNTSAVKDKNLSQIQSNNDNSKVDDSAPTKSTITSTANNNNSILPPKMSQSRLITYDRTDPEFDEDDDPDADLDL
jgi:hypothetical protein